MSRAQEFKNELMNEILTSWGADVTIAAGIVTIRFPDNSRLNFTVPEEVDEKGRTAAQGGVFVQ